MICKTKGMMRAWVVVLLGAAACHQAAAAPAGAVAASTPAPNIASHRTFSFGLTEMPAPGYVDSARTFEVQKRMQGLIAKTLTEKGYVEDPNKGELLVRFGAGNAHEDADETEIGSHGAVDWGRLEIDAYDAATNLQVWRSVAITQIDPRRIDDRIVTRAVQRALATFPPRTGASSPAAGLGERNRQSSN
jgi:hypothetical protein